MSNLSVLIIMHFQKGGEQKDCDGSENGFEEGTVVGLDKLESDTYRVQFLLTTGFIQVYNININIYKRVTYLLYSFNKVTK